MKGRELRQKILNKELIEYNPKKWRLNTPGKDYKFKVEDSVPALSGAIGKVALVAAFAMAWATGLNITDPGFVAENVRLEIIIAGIFTIIFCAVLNPYTGPPGTLATLIPVVSIMIIAGVHPLPLAILISVMGLIISGRKYFCKLININGAGTTGGIILLFGFLGIASSIDNLKNWAGSSNIDVVFPLLLVTGIVLYILLSRMNLRWLVIPVCAVAAITISAVFSQFPSFKTGLGLPVVDPGIWWNEKWGIGFGLNVENFVVAIPYALLAVVMWPIDALAVTTIQESNYPADAKKAVIDMNATYMVVSLRNIVGAFLGGSQISAVWRSFMIPLAIVKRPVGASALILGVLSVAFGLLGFPIDIAIFPPLLWLVLIFGIYIPLIEVGIAKINNAASAQIAAVCIVGGIAINPVIGWILAVFTENFGIIKDKSCNRVVCRKDKLLTAGLVIVVAVTYLLSYTI